MDYQEPPKVEHVQYVTIDENETEYYQYIAAGKSEEQMREEVRSAYGDVAKAKKESQCCGNARSCCGVSPREDKNYSEQLGYSQEDLDSVPEGCDIGLGCGNPQMIAELQEGEAVLDLGAGAGFDVFLAAQKVGDNGKVYGVDMTAEMLNLARENAKEGGYENVEFLLGEIEHLPLPNNTVDVVISNCVVNLSTNKAEVFKETFRVLKEGGRIAISDIVAYKPLPREMIEDKELYSNCISGALPMSDLEMILEKAGFTDISIEADEDSRMFIKDWVPNSDAENFVVSAKIRATKPRLREFL